MEQPGQQVDRDQQRAHGEHSEGGKEEQLGGFTGFAHIFEALLVFMRR